MAVTTVGRELVREALPEEYRHYADIPLDKKTMGNLATELAKRDSGKYVDVIQRLNDIGREVSYRHGRDASLSLRDITVQPALNAERARVKARIAAVMNDKGMTAEAKMAAIAKISDEFYGVAPEATYKYSKEDNTALARQITSGSRGNKKQLAMIMVGSGRVSPDGKNRSFYPITTGFAQGLSPWEYWLDSLQAKKGLVDVQLATSKSGYLSRQLSNMSHRVVVTEDDCGTANGIEVEDGADPDNVGAVLAGDVGNLKAGTVVKPEHLKLLEGKKVLLRSPVSCEAEEGVCAKCAGARETGGLPEKGAAIGITSANALAEQVTQTALGSKHVGESGGGGFQDIDTYFQVPSNFVGGAVLSHVEGRVKGIQKAPQGGHYVLVGTDRLYVPEDLKLVVKPGDSVEAGSKVSEGIPNPAELAKLKGLGAARKSMLADFGSLLARNGIKMNRRNLEVTARAFISKVKIDKPDAIPGTLPGDVVDYEVIASRWTPRKGAVLKSPSGAVNLYLEKPYLHHTIGTRITPGIAKELKEGGINKVMAHSEPPPFTPAVIRAKDFLGSDRDWMTRLMGENLKRNVLDAARMGSVSDPNSTSYVPRMVLGKAAPSVAGV